MEQEQERCPSVCLNVQCELPKGHKNKHHNAGVFWTNSGAKRLNNDQKSEIK
jgi:hypothetical protein